MKIAVDAMGGDYAPKEVVEGIELARDAYPDVEFQLFGQTDQIKKYLKNDDHIQIMQADEVIEMPFAPRSNPALSWLRPPLKRALPMHFSQLVTRVPFWPLACLSLAGLKELTDRV